MLSIEGCFELDLCPTNQDIDELSEMFHYWEQYRNFMVEPHTFREWWAGKFPEAVHAGLTDPSDMIWDFYPLSPLHLVEFPSLIKSYDYRRIAPVWYGVSPPSSLFADDISNFLNFAPGHYINSVSRYYPYHSKDVGSPRSVLLNSDDTIIRRICYPLDFLIEVFRSRGIRIKGSVLIQETPWHADSPMRVARISDGKFTVEKISPASFLTSF